RQTRVSMAQQTVAICNAGVYAAPSGMRVNIGTELDHAKKGTALYSPKNAPNVKRVALAGKTRLEARNETTFGALARLASSGPSHLACLNFASARNPGGG